MDLEPWETILYSIESHKSIFLEWISFLSNNISKIYHIRSHFMSIQSLDFLSKAILTKTSQFLAILGLVCLIWGNTVLFYFLFRLLILFTRIMGREINDIINTLKFFRFLFLFLFLFLFWLLDLRVDLFLLLFFQRSLSWSIKSFGLLLEEFLLSLLFKLDS